MNQTRKNFDRFPQPEYRRGNAIGGTTNALNEIQSLQALHATIAVYADFAAHLNCKNPALH